MQRSRKATSRLLLSMIIALLTFPTTGSSASNAQDQRIRNGKIAFSTRKQIYTMAPDGSAVRRIAETTGHNRTPAWSPRGTRIAFGCKGTATETRDICISRADGTRVRLLTDDETPDQMPAWSPDGRMLVFARLVGVSYQLFVIRRDGDATRQITLQPSSTLFPDWSPDGSRILFTSIGPLGSTDIFSVQPDGGGLTNLTMSPQNEGSAAWSPDGSQIAFSRDDGLMVMAADGSKEQALEHAGMTPRWSPNGQRLIATALRDSKSLQCFSIRADGSAVRWLSPPSKDCYSPDWAPAAR